AAPHPGSLPRQLPPCFPRGWSSGWLRLWLWLWLWLLVLAADGVGLAGVPVPVLAGCAVTRTYPTFRPLWRYRIRLSFHPDYRRQTNGMGLPARGHGIRTVGYDDNQFHPTHHSPSGRKMAWIRRRHGRRRFLRNTIT